MNKPVEDPSPKKARNRMRRHRAGHGLTATILLATLLLVGAAFVLSGRALPLPQVAVGSMMDTLNDRIAEGEVFIADARLAVAEGRKPRLDLREVAFRDAEGGTIAVLNEVTIDVSVGALLQGRVRAERVLVNGAQITVRRGTDGAFRFGVGGTDAVAPSTSLVDVLGLIDAAFDQGVLSAVGDIAVAGAVIALEDARSGRLWQATNARLSVRERVGGVAVSMSSDVFNGTDDLAAVEVSLGFDTGTRDTSVGVRMIDVPAADIALQSPALAWLSVMDAPISGAVRITADGKGSLATLDGTLDLGNGALRPSPGVSPIQFDAARAYFGYDPERSRLEFNEIGVQSDLIRVAASGHMYLDEVGSRLGESFIGQFTVDEVSFPNDSVFHAPVSIDRLFADLRLRLAPFSLELPSIVLENGEALAYASGHVDIADDRWRVSVDSESDRLGYEQVLALWPRRIAPKTRSWLSQNLLGGEITDVSFGVRYLHGTKPDLALSFDFDEANIRYLDEFPPVRDGRGRAELQNRNFTLVADQGLVDAPGGEVVSGAGTVFVVEDIRMKPPRATVSISAEGPLTPVLEIIDQPPLRLLSRAGRDTDFAEAQTQVDATINLPLRDELSEEDVDYVVSARAENVVSDVLIQDRILRAPEVVFRADKDGLRIEGAGDLDSVPIETVWSRPPLSQSVATSSATGQVKLNEERLASLGVSLPAGLFRGETTAGYELSLPPESPSLLKVRSDLRGISLSLPAIGWTKSSSTVGALELEVSLGETPDVQALSFSAPGLALTADVDFAQDGAFASLALDQLRVGAWFDGSAALRVTSVPSQPRIDILGGRLDLRELPAFSEDRRSAASTSEIGVALDEVVVTDTIQLSAFRGMFAPFAGGLNGEFSARVGGRTPVRGTLLPAYGRTALRIESEDAGGVLRDAGLTPNGRGGALQLNLTPVPNAPAGHYNGKFFIDDMRLVDAPLLAGMLDAVSVVGLIDELAGSGLWFDAIEGTFRLTPERLVLTDVAALGPSLGISAEGVYDVSEKQLDIQGVVSPIYFVNAIGAFMTRRGEGLFGFNYGLTGPVAAPSVSVNPLSILTPGMFREIFRRPMPTQ